jgi:hypothetical protein
MADITVSADIDTLLQSASNTAARTNLGLGTAATTASTAYATSAQGTKVDFLTVTQAVDLDQAEIDIAANTAKITNAMLIQGAASDETTALTVGTGKLTLRAPAAFTLTAVRASVSTAPTGSTIIVDVNEAGTSVLSTKLSIDATEKTSTTAATAAVISDSAIADDAELTIDIDQIGSTVAGAGLKITLIGTL